MFHRLSLAISLSLFLGWLLITIGGGLLQAGGTTSLDELATSGVVLAIPGAALFLLLAVAALGWIRAVGLTVSHNNRTLLVPSLAVAILVALSAAAGLPATDVLLLLVVNTAFVGISEELAFRGVLLSSLLGRMSVRRAVLISAVVFGAVHSFNAILTGEIAQALSQSVIAVGMGIWAGVLRVRTGSLVGPMVLHALWDLALFSVLTAATGSALASVTSVLAIVFVIILGIWGYRQLGRTA
jgi:membrane protease YdiL (CAAX protease family)